MNVIMFNAPLLAHIISKGIRMTCVAIGLTVSLCVSAQTDTPKDSARTLDNVTVLSQRERANVISSKPLQSLSREELTQLGLQELADAVKKFAGAQVKDYGGIGGMKTVSVRNLGAHHTAVSYDDVTMSNIQAGQIDISRYTLDQVESVTLSVGGENHWLQSARHYASGGVLSLKSLRQPEDGRRLLVKVRGASFGYVSPSVRYWQPLGTATTLSLCGAFTRADGIYPYTLVNGREKTRERRLNSDINSWQGEANLYHSWGQNGQIDTKVYWYRSERGLPGSVILYKGYGNERLWDEDFFAQTVCTRQLSRQLTLRARLKYAHSWNKYEDRDVKYPDGLRRDVARQNEYYASATLGWRPTHWLTMALAEDVFWGNLRSNVTISDNLTDPPYPERLTSLTALSANMEWGRLRVSANLVGTFAHERVKAGKQPDDRRKLSPTVSASYQLLPHQQLYLRAMMKNTFRMPTFNDLYYLRMGNTGLRPENAHEWNAGVTWSGQPVRWIKYLSVTADGYFNRVTDKIVAFPSTYVWKMANFGKVDIKGIDLTLATEIPLLETRRGRGISLLLTGAYTYLEATDKEERSNSYGSQLPYTPKQSGNFSAILRTPWVNAGYSMVAQGKRWSSTLTTPTYTLKAYQEHTVTLSRAFKWAGWGLDLQASLHNLTDAQYEIIKYYPMPGRSWSVSATLHL